MQENPISTKQAVCMLTLFTIGSSLNVGLNTASKQDAWVAILIGLVMAVPMIAAFMRLLSLYPGQNLFDVIFDVFGKVVGRVVILLYVLYIISVGALIMANFSDFIQVVAMPETPEIVLFTFMLVFCIYMTKSGIETFGHWSRVILAVVIAAEIGILLLSIRFMDFSNIKPVIGTDFNTLMGSSLLMFSLPFTETIIFAFLFSSLKAKNCSYKIYASGILIGTAILVMATLRDLLVLGVPTLSMYYFPSYAAVGVLSLGDFFSRTEVLIGMFFLLTGFAKICVCMFATSIGITKLIGTRNYKNLAVPSGLLMFTLATIFFPNSLALYNWLADTFKFYALPFQVALPLIMLVGAEIKIRIRKLKGTLSP